MRDRGPKRLTPGHARFAGLRRSLSSIVLLLACGSAGAEAAGKFPSAPVDIIVPFNAGAFTDSLARLVAEELSKKWGQPVNVVNKPGGNTVIGTHAVMSAKPDGYTLLADSIGSSSGQIGLKGLPFEVTKRTFLAMAVAVPLVVIASVNSPWHSLKDLVEAGKKDPASVVWSTVAGGRGGGDMVQLQLFEAAGIDVPRARRVDFTGSAPAINALAGGHVKLHAASPGAVGPAVHSGKARALAVTTPKRSFLMPDVPTTREAGFPTVDYTFWVGFSGPPGMPQVERDTIVKAIEDVIKAPPVLELLAKRFDAVPTFLGPEGFRKFVTDEAQLIARLERLMTGGK